MTAAFEEAPAHEVVDSREDRWSVNADRAAGGTVCKPGTPQVSELGVAAGETAFDPWPGWEASQARPAVERRAAMTPAERLELYRKSSLPIRA